MFFRITGKMPSSSQELACEEGTIGTVLEFLERTKVGCRSSARVKIGPWEGEDQESWGKVGGPGPP